MSSQMEQFFKVLLCLVMVALLIGVGSKYLESNYAKFDVKDIEDENDNTDSSDSE